MLYGRYECRRFENNDDLYGLCLKLLGSGEDKKIASAIAEWAKCKKYDRENVEPIDKTRRADVQPPIPMASHGPIFPYGGYPHFTPYPQFGQHSVSNQVIL